ncbi:MAG: hypothetical protein AAGN15_08275 [Cyanobacteria bacterium J06581_3]
MSHSVTVQEIIIILATQGQTPSVINADFLQYTGIIPEDWQLSRQPVYTEDVAQIAYQNNVTVTVQPNRIVVAQSVENLSTEEPIAPEIARKLAIALPKVNYRAFGFNAIGYVSFADDKAPVRRYLNQTLLADGPWQTFNGTPVETSFEFAYDLPQGRLSLSASEATLRKTDQPEGSTPILSLTGTVEHVLTQEDTTERLNELLGHLDSWQSDLNTYIDLVNNGFLPTAIMSEVAAKAELYKPHSNHLAVEEIPIAQSVV